MSDTIQLCNSDTQIQLCENSTKIQLCDSAPDTCPCDPWPPESWPCGGMNETYQLSYRLQRWLKTDCDGPPDVDQLNSCTLTADASTPCQWVGDCGVLYLLLGNWRLSIGVFSPAKGVGGTPVGAYPDVICGDVYGVWRDTITDIAVS